MDLNDNPVIEQFLTFGYKTENWHLVGFCCKQPSGKVKWFLSIC